MNSVLLAPSLSDKCLSGGENKGLEGAQPQIGALRSLPWRKCHLTPLARLPLVPPSPGVAGSPRSGQPGSQLPERPAEQAHAPARGRPKGLRGDLPRAAAGQHGPALCLTDQALGPPPLPSPVWHQPTCPSSQAGANINAVDKQQRTPLMEAVVNNHLEVARYMVQRGGCVYNKVWQLGSRAQGLGPGSRCQQENSSPHVSLRRRMAPLASTMQPKLGTWRWSACCSARDRWMSMLR